MQGIFLLTSIIQTLRISDGLEIRTVCFMLGKKNKKNNSRRLLTPFCIQEQKILLYYTILFIIAEHLVLKNTE